MTYCWLLCTDMAGICIYIYIAGDAPRPGSDVRAFVPAKCRLRPDGLKVGAVLFSWGEVCL